MDPVEQYYELVSKIDKDAKRLTELHGDAITCKPGCTTCCVNLTVFPVEHHAIRRAMAETGATPGEADFDPSAACGFLHRGRCRIYPFRPIICRTHGLPILFWMTLPESIPGRSPSANGISRAATRSNSPPTPC